MPRWKAPSLLWPHNFPRPIHCLFLNLGMEVAMLNGITVDTMYYAYVCTYIQYLHTTAALIPQTSREQSAATLRCCYEGRTSRYFFTLTYPPGFADRIRLYGAQKWRFYINCQTVRYFIVRAYKSFESGTFFRSTNSIVLNRDDARRKPLLILTLNVVYFVGRYFIKQSVWNAWNHFVASQEIVCWI
jgi:hypothetical protein